jgi:CheY-like chemotaxis protein
MCSAESESGPQVLFLNQNSSLAPFVSEILALEGIPHVTVVTTAAQAMSALSRHSGSSSVLIDNLQVHDEGQQFLEHLRREPDLRARLRTICMAVEFNCTWARQTYGDVLDAYLELPFTIPQLLEVLQVF